jgi:hypothetical protein
MSTLNVSNITDGTTTVGTSYVVNGSTKAWANFTGVSSTAVRDSLNVSSLTDNGTGNTTVNFSSAMNNANYTGSWYTNSGNYTSHVDFSNYLTGGFGSRTTTSYGVFAWQNSNAIDAYFNDTTIFGDLA